MDPDGQLQREGLNLSLLQVIQQHNVPAPCSLPLLNGTGTCVHDVQRAPFQLQPLLKAAKEQPLLPADAVPPLLPRPGETGERPDPCGSCAICRRRQPAGERQRRQQREQQECPVALVWDAIRKVQDQPPSRCTFMPHGASQTTTFTRQAVSA
jgi:hypothetical protein